MKILHLTLDFGDGGAEKFIVHLSNQQQKYGHTVAVCSLWDLKSTEYFHNQLHPDIAFVSLGKKRGFDITIFKKLYDLIRDKNPDVIHTHRSTINYILPLLFFYKKKQFVHTVHNDAFKETPQKILRKIKSIYFKKKAIIPVTISQESQESFFKAYRLKAKCIYNGIPEITRSTEFDEVKKSFERIKTNRNSKIIINIGRISPQKNQKLLIQVINRLIAEGEDIILLIIGRREILFNDLSNFQGERIIFLGSKSNATDYLLNADAFCLSSLYEGMPISLIEAFAAKCIPIVTPVGGMKNMVKNNYNGYLAKDVTFEALYKSFRLFLAESNEKKEKLKNNCYIDFRKNYHIDSVYNNYMNVYNEK